MGLFLLDSIVRVASEKSALLGDAGCTSPISPLVLATLLAVIGVFEVFVLKSENCFLVFRKPYCSHPLMKTKIIF